MARRGLRMRKPNDVSNEANIARGTKETADNAQSLVRNFSKISVGQRLEQPTKTSNAKKEEVQPAKEEECAQPNPPKVTIFEKTALSVSVGKEETGVDYHRAGIFWRVDLDSAHSDYLVDIINYAFSRQVICPY
ncbi:unnamed protein product [Haemonchus placei]|uniref:TerD domain-containing protein n=1 Tax=Haemonchus placei TaxID=6290 RepID=A0A0N4WJN9_HAEPC|nr:unnamed protein product [Haemonchus placei]